MAIINMHGGGGAQDTATSQTASTKLAPTDLGSGCGRQRAGAGVVAGALVGAA